MDSSKIENEIKIERTEDSSTSLKEVAFHALWVVPLFYVIIIMPFLRDAGITVPVNDKLSADLTSSHLEAVRESGIGYIRSGAGSMLHGGSVRLYDEYKGLIPQLAFKSFDYRAPANTPHAHFIIHPERIEVRFDADISVPYQTALEELKEVVDFALSRQRQVTDTMSSWE